MKKSTILLLWTLVFSFSCDNLLDKEPLDQVSNADALENIEVVSIAMIGTYSGLLNTSYYFSMMVTYPEFAGGNVKLGNSTTSIGIERYNSLYNFTTTPFPNGTSSTRALGIYGDIYDVINRANNIIAAIPNLPDGTPEERNNLLGEAYFFRALAHFDLLRVYSQAYNFTADASHLGIALLESTPEVFELPARNTVLEVYEFIIDDLTQAIDLINENSQRTTSTTIWLSSNAAKALLARVHLYKEDWQVAARLASEVIESGAYQLATTDDYESIWSGL
ncbi:MAG: RagB/SusD family nutrient uptake outer membrane protein, partial [Bacteroidota bacterium]